MSSKPGESKSSSGDEKPLPTHVAIIMDGNGRWARKRLLNRVKGHERGTATVRNIVKASRELGIRYLTLYAFSTENWQRPKAEVTALMSILKNFLKSEKQEMLDRNIKLNTIGDTQKLPDAVKATLQQTLDATADNTGLTLTLALSYGGRTEIVKMVREIATRVSHGETEAAAISEQMIAGALDTRDIPDPDLMIRTSGEVRISNFLLWQLAYAELFFTDTLWPDFSREEFEQILQAYQKRDRRYGKIK
ncbi:MAG: isoprenyl transferase [Desulfobacterales bacterium]|nr:isoprenyl transferase [Desulfobacterales bacterium]